MAHCKSLIKFSTQCISRSSSKSICRAMTRRPFSSLFPSTHSYKARHLSSFMERPPHMHLSQAWTLTHQFCIRQISFGKDLELSAVEIELGRIAEERGQDPGVKEKQLSLFKSLTKDMSEPTSDLVAKLNCETNLSADQVYFLAVAAFEARAHVSEGEYLMQLAASMFGYAGERGDHNALYTYAQLLRTGQGVTVDLPKAADILTDLAMKGHPYAQFALAGMYYSGSGVTQSFQKAYTLCKVSSQNSIPQAFNLLGNMHQYGQGVEEDLKLAVEYYQKGCEFGDPMAHISLAQCYANGKGVENSPEKAFQNYLEASKSNNPLALYNVATHYFSGVGVKEDLKKAVEFYEKASMLGFPPAHVNLGNMYYAGIGVSKSLEKARELFSLAAERDDSAKELLKVVEEEIAKGTTSE